MANWRARAVASNNCRVATAAGLGRKALSVGRAMAMRIPMMEMTTRSSIRVKALLVRNAECGVQNEGWQTGLSAPLALCAGNAERGAQREGRGKFQAPSSKFKGSSKFQAPKPTARRRSWGFRAWNFSGAWSLGFGACMSVVVVMNYCFQLTTLSLLAPTLAGLPG